jgi:hypothetical protein
VAPHLAPRAGGVVNSTSCHSTATHTSNSSRTSCRMQKHKWSKESWARGHVSLLMPWDVGTCHYCRKWCGTAPSPACRCARPR